MSFKDLEEGGYIYIIEPSNKKITQRRIKFVKDHPWRVDYLHIGIFKLAHPEDVDSDRVVDTYPEKLPVKELYVPKNASIVITKEFPPIPYASSKQKLEEWMDKST